LVKVAVSLSYFPLPVPLATSLPSTILLSTSEKLGRKHHRIAARLAVNAQVDGQGLIQVGDRKLLRIGASKILPPLPRLQRNARKCGQARSSMLPHVRAHPEHSNRMPPATAMPFREMNDADMESQHNNALCTPIKQAAALLLHFE
jgi:hypothetical protein